MVERIVSSLAILKVNADFGKNYVDNYVPFVAECIRLGSDEPVSVAKIQESVAREFGLQIPQTVLKTILSRVHRSGYLLLTKGVYQRDDKALPFPELLPARNKALREHEALVYRLQNFCASQNVQWSREEADAALLSFLDSHSLGILRSSVDGRRLIQKLVPPEHTDFLVGGFIAQLEKQDPEGFEFLDTVVKGLMLADALFLPGATTGSTSFKNISVFLDTTFVLRVIGGAQQQLQTPCRELIDLLREQRASLKIFEHTRAEIEGILTAARGRLGNVRQSNGAIGETVEYFIQTGVTPSDVDMLIGSLNERLAQYQITTVPAPKHELHLGVDEAKLRQLLQEEVRYKHEYTLQKDVLSLTAIHRLREGRVYSTIEDCRAVFVTTNTKLALTGSRFFNQEHEGGTLAVPHCLNDQVIATLAWLKTPSNAPSLPRHMLIASCYAALKPSDTLWQKYLVEIDRLMDRGVIGERDYYLLRYASSARQALMNFTLGEPEVFTEGTVEEVLAHAQAEIRREAEEEAQKANDERRAAVNTLAQAASTVSQANLVHRQRIEAISVRGGRIVRQISQVILISVLSAISLLIAPWPFQDGSNVTWRWIVFIATLVITVVSIWSMYNGTTIAHVVDGIELWATRHCEAALLRVTRWLKVELPDISNPSISPYSEKAIKNGD